MTELRLNFEEDIHSQITLMTLSIILIYFYVYVLSISLELSSVIYLYYLSMDVFEIQEESFYLGICV
jgi:hypothetical protein